MLLPKRVSMYGGEGGVYDGGAFGGMGACAVTVIVLVSFGIVVVTRVVVAACSVVRVGSVGSGRAVIWDGSAVS